MLIIQRPTVEASARSRTTASGSPSARSSPASGTRSATRSAGPCCRPSPGAAVTQVRFDDALHEFTTLPGVKEDVTDIILNLKDLVLRVHADEPVTLRFDKRGPGDATAGDLQLTADVEVLNPELHIATLNAKGRLAIDVTVERGRGYVSAERNKRSTTIGVIPVDSIFSPVRRVAFSVEPVRVEQSTDFDRLVLDIETDGSITPREALASAGDTLRSLVGLVADLEDEPQGLELGEMGTSTSGSPDLDLPIEDLDLSERPRNCLKRAQVNTIGELVERTHGRPAGHHQLRPEVPRRGHPAPRRAGPVAPDQGLRPGCTGRPKGPPHGRRRRPPEGHARQPGGLADRRRVARHDRGQGQGPAAGGREVHHRGPQGRRPPAAPGGGPHPGQGHGPQALRGDRPPLRRPARAATPGS